MPCCLVRCLMQAVGTGRLPDEWAVNGSFPALQELNLAINRLSGSLPASYLSASPFPYLRWIILAGNELAGTIPAPQPACSLCKPKASATHPPLNMLKLCVL